MNTTEHDLRQIKFLEHVTEESQSKQHIVQDLIPVPLKIFTHNLVNPFRNTSQNVKILYFKYMYSIEIRIMLWFRKT